MASFLLRLQLATWPLIYLLFVDIFPHGKFDYFNWGDKVGEGVKQMNGLLWEDWQPAFPSVTSDKPFPSSGTQFSYL